MGTEQILILAMIQGAAELLPVSSSAHVIVAEKLMGLDPSSPEMTFLLVMLHTGTMFAVLVFFWSRWKKLNFSFLKMTLVATAVTGVVGLGLKKLIEKIVLERMLGESHAEIEQLFRSMPLVAAALFAAGLLILYSGYRLGGAQKLGGDLTGPAFQKGNGGLTPQISARVGLVQAVCLPFRGFSRSGATISTALLSGVEKNLAEDFSFALALWLTPPVLVLELHRLLKFNGLLGVGGETQTSTSAAAVAQTGIDVLGTGAAAAHAGMGALFSQLGPLLLPGLLGMVFSFGAGLLALRWLSSWLASDRWKYFGYYCLLASVFVFWVR